MSTKTYSYTAEIVTYSVHHLYLLVHSKKMSPFWSLRNIMNL